MKKNNFIIQINKNNYNNCDIHFQISYLIYTGCILDTQNKQKSDTNS